MSSSTKVAKESTLNSLILTLNQADMFATILADELATKDTDVARKHS